MGYLTISNSGTAYIRDMMAQGKAVGDWSKSPYKDYYASLDTSHPMDKPPELATTWADLQKVHAEFDQWNAVHNPEGAAEAQQQQLKTIATERGLPATGNVINTQA
jgi:hypothetical protein